jgi:hypothetical protein
MIVSILWLVLGSFAAPAFAYLLLLRDFGRELQGRHT